MKLKTFAKIFHRKVEKDNSLTYTIEATTYCNLKCRFCPRPNIELKSEHIDFCNFKKIIQEIKIFHSQKYFDKNSEIIYCGLGEPFLHPLALDHLRYIRQELPKAKIQIDTNATMLNKRVQQTLVHEALVDTVSVSLNAPNRERYYKLMLVDAFDKVLTNLQDFIKERKRNSSNIKISVAVKDTDDNREDNITIEKYLKNDLLLSSDQFWVNDILNWGGIIDTTLLKKQSLSPIDFPCYGMICVNNIVFDLHLNVYPCCSALGLDRENSPLKLGNILEKPLDRIWNQKKHIQIKRTMLKGNIKSLLPCKYCTMYSDKNLYDVRYHSREKVVDKLIQHYKNILTR